MWRFTETGGSECRWMVQRGDRGVHESPPCSPSQPQGPPIIYAYYKRTPRERYRIWANSLRTEHAAYDYLDKTLCVGFTENVFLQVLCREGSSFFLISLRFIQWINVYLRFTYEYLYQHLLNIVNEKWKLLN